MITKNMLLNRYNRIVPDNKEKFLSEINAVKRSINFNKLGNKPLLIYTDGHIEAICYLLLFYYSSKDDRLLDYRTISGESLTRLQLTSEENRDIELYNHVRYTDMSFVTITGFEQNINLIESIVIELVDYRETIEKRTVVIYDKRYTKAIKKVKNLDLYFSNRGYQVVDISGITQDTVQTTQDSVKTKQGVETTKRNMGEKLEGL